MSPPVPIRLSRTLVDLHPDDLEGVRAWMRESVETDVMLHGAPTPRLLRVGPGRVESLDLTRLRRRDPQADPGATWVQLREAHADHAHFAVLGGPRPADEDLAQGALLVQATADAFRTEVLSYRRDEDSGLGHPGAWGAPTISEQPPGDLLPHAWGARPARVLTPRTPRADVGVRYGELPDAHPPPSIPLHLVELVSHMFVPDLLAGRTHGVIVVRLCGRDFEAFELPNASPVPLDDFVRHVANEQLPPADAAALVQLAVQPDVEPPEPGVQIVAEVAGGVAETWSPLTFPDGPEGPASITDVELRRREPVPPEGLWLGVPPDTDLALTSPSTGEA